MILHVLVGLSSGMEPWILEDDLDECVAPAAAVSACFTFGGAVTLDSGAVEYEEERAYQIPPDPLDAEEEEEDDQEEDGARHGITHDDQDDTQLKCSPPMIVTHEYQLSEMEGVRTLSEQVIDK